MIVLPITIIILIGILASYSDITEGKIRNRTILFGLVWGIVGILFYPSLPHLIDSIFALFIGFLFWFTQVWSAGDGKLFTVFALLVPASAYVFNRFSYFQSINILINTFVPLAFFLSLNMLIKTSWKYKTTAFQQAFALERVMKTAVILFSFLWVAELIVGFIPVGGSYFLTMAVVFLAAFACERFVGIGFFPVMLICAGLRVIFDATVWSGQSWLHFLGILLSFLVLRFFFLELGFLHYTTEIPIEDLKPGMVPGEVVYKKDYRLHRKKKLFFSFFSYLRSSFGRREHHRAESLTNAAIEKIKTLQQQHPDLRTMTIQETVPFAPFLLAGVLLTLLVQGNVFLWVSAMF